MKTSFTLRKLCVLGIMAALSVVLALAVRFPLFPAAPYLEFDAGDVPILLSAFLYGPFAGLAVTLVTALVQGLTVSSAAGIWGIVMHILASGVFCMVAGAVHRAMPMKKGIVLGLGLGAIASVLVMIPANLFITPLYTGGSVEMVKALLLPTILPFNLLKCVILCALTFALYRPVSRLFVRLWGESDVF